MAEPPEYPDSDVESGGDSTNKTPLWVKVFGAIAIALVLVFVFVLLTGVGGHGPGRHKHSGGLGGDTPPSSPTEHRA